MGPIGMPEIIMILIVIVVLAIPVGIVIALVWYFSARTKTAQAPAAPPTVQERLLAIDALRSQNLISEAEHEAKRSQLIDGL